MTGPEGGGRVATIKHVALDIEALYQSSYRDLLRLASLLCADVPAGEDCVQDAFMKLASSSYSLRDTDSALGYIRSCIVNGSRSLHRRRLVARRYLPQLRQPDVEGADSAVLLASRDEAIRKGVARLPHRQREVIVLRFWADLTTVEVAQRLGVSEATVKTCSSRAMRALQNSIEDTS